MKLVLLLAAGLFVHAETVELWLHYIPASQTYEVRKEESLANANASPVASINFEDRILENGWGYLNATSYSGFPDKQQAYGLGYLEAFATHERMRVHMHNIWAENYGVGKMPPPDMVQFVMDQFDFAVTMTAKHAGQDPYWRAVGLVLAQLDGLVDGMVAMGGTSTTDRVQVQTDLLLLQADGDLESLFPIYIPKSPAVQARMQLRAARDAVANGDISYAQTDCSAFIKPLRAADGSVTDVLVGHTTWRAFAAMTRIFKRYTMNLAEGPVAVSFSAMPGYLVSKDDFYVTHNNMVVLETTNSIYNQTLAHTLTPQSMFVWQRGMVANLLATSGPEWAGVFARYNSGTYNNQWMIVDYKVLAAQSAFPANLLYIWEQVPTTGAGEDVTGIMLEQDYWGSYNIPYNRTLFELSEFNDAKQEDNYYNCSRAQIFRREQHTVHTLTDLKRLIRFNKYQTDPVSRGLPNYAIASRYDLLPKEHMAAFGAVDAKVTNRALAAVGGAEVISGPTADDQAPFSWPVWDAKSGRDPTRHRGHPDVFDFPFVRMPMH